MASRRREVNVPMMTETHRRLALELRMTVETLIARPSVDIYNQVSKMLAALNRGGMPQSVLDPATLTMNSICDRFERMGKVGVTSLEAAILRRALASIDGAMTRIPINKLDVAVALVDAWCASVGA